jgi:hypothetical protein
MCHLQESAVAETGLNAKGLSPLLDDYPRRAFTGAAELRIQAMLCLPVMNPNLTSFAGATNRDIWRHIGGCVTSFSNRPKAAICGHSPGRAGWAKAIARIYCTDEYKTSRHGANLVKTEFGS